MMMYVRTMHLDIIMEITEQHVTWKVCTYVYIDIEQSIEFLLNIHFVHIKYVIYYLMVKLYVI